MSEKTEMGKILVVGSLNMDFVVKVNEMPQPKETVLGNSLELVPGGKGANQAYTIGKLGGNVSMIGAVGADIYGQMLTQNLCKADVCTQSVQTLEDVKTGVAFITVNSRGENNIVVIPGANGKITKELIDRNIALINECAIVVMQLEIPLEVASHTAKLAKARSKIVVLDPAPAPAHLPDELIQNVDIMKPNEIELQMLTGMPTDTQEEIVAAAQNLIGRGAGMVIVTMGGEGSMMVTAQSHRHFPAIPVQVVDTTAAGDSFTAALVLALAQKKSYEEAIEFGSRVSTIVVTRKGAQTSIPTSEEVREFYSKNTDMKG